MTPKIDQNSETWREITAYLRYQIEAVRDSLEMKDIEAPATEYMRGVIAAYRDVLGLDSLDIMSKKPTIPSEPGY